MTAVAPKQTPQPPSSWSEPQSATLERLETTGEGLSSAEAAARLQRYGPNEPHWRRSRRTALLDGLRRVFNPLVVVLLVASAMSALVGELVDAVIIALMVLASGTIDLFQTHRSQRAAEQLRRRVEVKAATRRDGAWQDISLRALVPGDRIRLSAGDIVPADARLLSANYLHLDESALTGESLPVEKEPGTTRDGLFMGTVVTGGSGEAVIVRTGADTGYAQIAARLSGRTPPTAFDRGLRAFGMLIARTVAALVVFVLVVNLAERRDPLESLLFAIALAVGLTPEFLPMIMSVTQAEGALRMARARVIVRQLAAIQNFGNMDILCSDKTGTLTEGRMRVNRAVDADGAPSERVGRYARANAALQAGLRSPFDEALLADGPVEDLTKVGEIPFDFERRRVSIAVEADARRLLIAKGAPESVLAVSGSVARADGDLPLGAAERVRIDRLIESLGAEGFRLLAVATRTLPPGGAVTPADEHDLTFEGLVAFSDPPKEGVAGVVAALQQDGIRLKILTGDAEAVTRHICADIGLLTDGIVTGDHIEELDDHALQELVLTNDVFARVTPEQKLRIIRAL